MAGVTTALRRLVSAPAGRYTLLAAVGLVIVGLETVRGTHQVGDFWEHAATVRELMRHTADPGNSLLAVHVPSAFFSPYTLLVALVADAANVSPVHALAAAGLVNYCLLVAGVWCFTRAFSRRAQAPFYALLFLWLLWGVRPWEYSGFFDLRELGYGIAYPSTFATAVGMLTAGLWQRTVSREGRARWVGAAITAVAVAAVLLTHPVAGVATVAAIGAISLTAGDRRAVILLAAALAVAAGLCLVWPYFSVISLLKDQGVYDPSNQLMYQGWLKQIFPASLALLLLVRPTGSLRRLRLGIYCAPLLAFFVYGRVTRHWSDGREIAYLVLGAQVGLADLAATSEQHAWRRRSPRRILLLAAALTAFVALEVVNMADGVRGSLPGTGSAEPAIYAAYRAAVTGLPADAPVAAPLNAGMESAIPVYGGKLVATDRPLAFVTGQTARRQAIDAFYSPRTAQRTRRAIIARYHVAFVLVPTAGADRAVARQLLGLGTVVRRTAAFVTLAV